MGLYKDRLVNARGQMSEAAIRAAKCQRTKARNAARKEAMAAGVSRRDAVRMKF